jgi:hypothetical protein
VLVADLFYPSLMTLRFCFPDLGENRTCAEKICEQNCTQLSNGGFICSCRPGFKPSTLDKNSCQGRTFFLPLLFRELCFFCCLF